MSGCGIDGIVHRLDEALELKLDKQKKHNIEVVVDRVDLQNPSDKETKARIADSVETALKLGQGIVIINRLATTDHSPRWSSGEAGRLPQKKAVDRSRLSPDDLIFSELFACQKCGISLPEIAPRIFSFNSPYGACPDCQGLGTKLEIDPKLVIPNPNLTLAKARCGPGPRLRIESEDRAGTIGNWRN